MTAVVKQQSEKITFNTLRNGPAALWKHLGCAFTLPEITQQPATWRATANRLQKDAAAWRKSRPPGCIVLTGSGSSAYAAECLAPVVQAQLGVACQAIASGTLLADCKGTLPPADGLLVSVARSGDSPESTATIDTLLNKAPRWRHLVITCNADGALATRYQTESRVEVVLLDPSTNDHSLVMTSSFTNLVLAGACTLLKPASADAASTIAETLFERYGDALSAWGTQPRDAIVYLGSSANFGAAREAALKSLEMSAGAVRVMAETSLGLRHGPMAWLNRDSLLVCFLSGRSNIRQYEADLLNELTRKQLGLARIVVGEKIDTALVGEHGLAIDLPGLYTLPPTQQAMLHVVVGQLLALFRCLALGLKPDAPSQGILTRVVRPFALHKPEGTLP